MKKAQNVWTGTGVMLGTALAANAAWAGPIAEKSADDVSNKAVQVIQNIAGPLGSAVIFGSVLIAAIKIIASSGNPVKRAEALGQIPYILIGGCILGGAMLLAGFIIGTGKQLGS